MPSRTIKYLNSINIVKENISSGEFPTLQISTDDIFLEN